MQPMKKISILYRPIYLLIVVNVMAFALLYLYKTKFDQKLLLAGFLITGMVLATYLLITRRKMGDEYLFLVVAMLANLGIMMIYRLGEKQGFKQILWYAAGIILFFLSYFIYLKFHRWNTLIYYYIGAAFGFFFITLIFGSNIKGATNWIVVGGYSFQPSELIRILFIFFLAAYFNKPGKLAVPRLEVGRLSLRVSSRITLTAVSYLLMGFLVLQRDWGTALLFFTIYIAMLYVLDDRMDFLAANFVLAAAGGTVGYFLLYHIRVRFETWWNPWKDIAGKGYQITQSLFAIGSGGFFGTGIGMGRPDFIPEVHTDFIFSAICEEMGIFGGAAVILLYFILAYRGFKISLTEKNIFDKAVALGITAMFGFQAFIIIGGVIKLIPLTGITLPFISYGGSSMTTSFIALGILQAISRCARKEEESENNANG